jgi:hypothetical protein
MNFDNKHLIRWGLPGWVFLMFIAIYLLTKEIPFISNLNKEDNIPIIGLLALLGGLGVPIGYLIHQISMYFGFIIFNKRDKVFKEEFRLDIIFSSHAKGDDLRRRYVHFLTRVHEVRGLMFSCLLSLLVIYALEEYKFSDYDIPTIIILSVNLVFLLISFVNQWYYTNNLSFYVNKIMQSEKHNL